MNESRSFWPTDGHSLSLWADANLVVQRYGQMMRFLHAVRHDIRAHVWDYALAAAVAVVAIVVLATRIDVADGSADRFHIRSDTTWSWAVTIAICATLIGRRRWPLRAFAVAVMLFSLLDFSKHREGVALLALIISVYSVSANLPFRLAWRAMAMTAALFAVGLVVVQRDLNAELFTGPGFLAAGFGLGLILRARRLQQEREVEAAIQRVVNARESADLRAAEDRLRLAQELHDVVAHSLSVIAVQAGIGAHLIDRQPADAARALDAIRTTSHTATQELHRLVDILRDGDPHDSNPAPALTDVGALIEQIRSMGVPITHNVDGDLTQVPPGVSLAAYRIVQEALTNIVRHAGRAEASVLTRVTDDCVELLIDDDGLGTTTALDPRKPQTGHGLIGMGERAEMYGGAVHLGGRPGGGFRVRATLPFSGTTPANDQQIRLTNPANPVPVARSNRARRWGPPVLWDFVLAIVMAGLVTLESVGTQATLNVTDPNYSAPQWWTWVLRIGCCLMLAARRRFPLMTLFVSGAVIATLSIRDDQVGVIGFVLAIGLYNVGSYATTLRLVASLIGFYVMMVIVALSKPPDLNPAGAVWVSFIFTGAAIVGYVARRDRERRNNFWA